MDRPTADDVALAIRILKDWMPQALDRRYLPVEIAQAINTLILASQEPPPEPAEKSQAG